MRLEAPPGPAQVETIIAVPGNQHIGHNLFMLREPVQVQISDDGAVPLPMGLLVEAGLDPGSEVLAYSDGDGRIVMCRLADAEEHLLSRGDLP